MATNPDDLPTPEAEARRRSRLPALTELATGGPATAIRYARRVAATARNAAEVARFGGLETGESGSPFTVEAEAPNYRLRHYFADDVPAEATPILSLIHI